MVVDKAYDTEPIKNAIMENSKHLTKYLSKTQSKKGQYRLKSPSTLQHKIYKKTI
jgi:DNA topoisomerase VI subunit B